jgi:hypothetical protein
MKVERFSWKAQERNGRLETIFRITDREESFEGESLGALDPERGIQGMGELKKPPRG